MLWANKTFFKVVVTFNLSLIYIKLRASKNVNIKVFYEKAYIISIYPKPVNKLLFTLPVTESHISDNEVKT